LSLCEVDELLRQTIVISQKTGISTEMTMNTTNINFFIVFAQKTGPGRGMNMNQKVVPRHRHSLKMPILVAAARRQVIHRSLTEKGRIGSVALKKLDYPTVIDGPSQERKPGQSAGSTKVKQGLQ
jgi:hypothetical protein